MNNSIAHQNPDEQNKPVLLLVPYLERKKLSNLVKVQRVNAVQLAGLSSWNDADVEDQTSETFGYKRYLFQK